MLELKDISKIYGQNHALDHLNAAHSEAAKEEL